MREERRTSEREEIVIRELKEKPQECVLYRPKELGLGGGRIHRIQMS